MTGLVWTYADVGHSVITCGESASAVNSPATAAWLAGGGVALPYQAAAVVPADPPELQAQEAGVLLTEALSTQNQESDVT